MDEIPRSSAKASGYPHLCLVVLAPMSLLFLYFLPSAPTMTVQLVDNWGFENWFAGEPSNWEVMVEPGTDVARSSDSIEGDFSVQFITTDSNDTYLRQMIHVDQDQSPSLRMRMVFRIDGIDDTDSKGTHSLTGLEVGLEGGDVDGDGQPEYMYHYFFTDDCVRVEDFPAWQYNTTPPDEPHKRAFLHRIQSTGSWNTFECDISNLFLETLGGYPEGQIDLRLWALRWGDRRHDAGINATVDSLRIYVGEMGHISCLLVFFACLCLGLRSRNPAVLHNDH